MTVRASRRKAAFPNLDRTPLHDAARERIVFDATVCFGRAGLAVTITIHRHRPTEARTCPHRGRIGRQEASTNRVVSEQVPPRTQDYPPDPGLPARTARLGLLAG